MMKVISPFLFWTARVLGILFALLVSLFALDVFRVARPFVEMMVALLSHLVPTAIVLIVLLIANRHGFVGGVMFLLIGAAYIFQTLGESWAVALTFGGIPILIGIMFILEGVFQRTAHPPEETLSDGEA